MRGGPRRRLHPPPRSAVSSSARAATSGRARHELAEVALVTGLWMSEVTSGATALTICAISCGWRFTPIGPWNHRADDLSDLLGPALPRSAVPLESTPVPREEEDQTVVRGGRLEDPFESPIHPVPRRLAISQHADVVEAVHRFQDVAERLRVSRAALKIIREAIGPG